MLAGSRLSGAALFLCATLGLLGFTLAPGLVPTAPAAPSYTDAPATALDVSPADTVLSVADVRATSPAAAAAKAAHYSMITAAIRAEGQDWLGTPYRWGGTTRRGIDCSAFVQKLVRATFEIELPRTTATQVHRGVRISRDELMPGDLVFFRRRGVRHVGVYLGNGDFIHASSSRGVTVSTMERGYWNRYYWQSRRILPEFEPPVPEPRLVRDEARSAVRALDSSRTVRN